MALKIESPVETAIGAVVLAAAILFGVYAANSADGGPAGAEYDRYTAHFFNASGVTPGTEVRVAGVRVGEVVDIVLEAPRYRAVVTMSVDRSVRLSDEATASIDAEGLLGGAYIDLDPGSGESEIASGDRVRYANSAVSFRTIITNLAGGSEPNAN